MKNSELRSDEINGETSKDAETLKRVYEYIFIRGDEKCLGEDAVEEEVSAEDLGTLAEALGRRSAGVEDSGAGLETHIHTAGGFPGYLDGGGLEFMAR